MKVDSYELERLFHDEEREIIVNGETYTFEIYDDGDYDNQGKYSYVYPEYRRQEDGSIWTMTMVGAGMQGDLDWCPNDCEINLLFDGAIPHRGD